MTEMVQPTLVSRLRGGAGARVHAKLGPRPERRLELYEFEACPFCRKVREAITMLDLEVLVYPSPKRGTRHRPRAEELGGRAQFPYLVDPNRDVALYESNAIVRHLYRFYGDGSPPLIQRTGVVGDLLSTLGGGTRLAAGGFASPSRASASPLELFGFEASVACQRVRERLCELELSYVLRSAAEGGEGARQLGERGLAPPLLLDPNTGVEISDADAIVTYLEHYAAT